MEKANLLDIRITDDRHIMAIDLAKNKAIDSGEITKALKSSGATEVNDKKLKHKFT